MRPNLRKIKFEGTQREVTISQRPVAFIEKGATGPQGPPGTPGTPGEGSNVKEVLSGLIDGSNQLFPTSLAFVPNSTQVYLNGLMLDGPDDYLETGDQAITMTDPPIVGDKLVIIYNVSEGG